MTGNTTPDFDSLTVDGLITGFVTATGATTARTLAARAADVANVLDYGAGIGGDDAAAIRGAIASGKKVIYIPPGTYTMKSTVDAYGSADGPSCLEINNKQNLVLIAYGVMFLTADALSPTVPMILSITNNSRHCAVLGGTFVGNRLGLSPTQENVAININSATDITLRDCKITGDFLTAICGVYVFDSTFDNLHVYNTETAIDMAFLENLQFQRCQFWANTATPYTGVNIHYDVPTHLDNAVTYEAGGARALIGGNSNNLRFLDCLFDGFANGIAIDAVNGALISRTVIRNGLVTTPAQVQCGVLLYRGVDAIAAGLPTSNIAISDCDIYNMGGVSPVIGCGVYIDTSSGTVPDVSVLNSRIYDNNAYGITSLHPANVSGLIVSGCDFRSRNSSGVQTADMVSTLLTQVASAADYVTATGGTTSRTLADWFQGLDKTGTSLSVSGSLTATSVTSQQDFTLGTTSGAGRSIFWNAAAGTTRGGYFYSDGSLRFQYGVDGIAEAGSNVGSSFFIARYSDAGSSLGNALVIQRATGMVQAVTGLAIGAAGGPTWTGGTGAPATTQPLGSMWSRTDGGVGTTLYVSRGGGVWNPVAGV